VAASFLVSTRRPGGAPKNIAGMGLFRGSCQIGADLRARYVGIAGMPPVTARCPAMPGAGRSEIVLFAPVAKPFGYPSVA